MPPSTRSRLSSLALIVLSSAVSLAGLGTTALASPDWSGAQRKAEEFDHHADELMREAPQQSRKIVEAIANAGDDERKRAAESASSSAASRLRDQYSSLERDKREALDALDQVKRDDKDHASDAGRLVDKIKSRWDKITETTRGLRDGRPRVAEYMLSRGESAIHDHLDRCHVKDFSVNGRRAECVIASGGDTCYVVAMTGNNSNAISRGRDRARSAADALTDEARKPGSDVMKHLHDRRSDFDRCKKFEARVDCYKLKPDVRDDNSFNEPSPDWHERC